MYSLVEGKFITTNSSLFVSFGRRTIRRDIPLKGLSHEIDFENVDEKGQIFALIRAAAGF